MKKKWLWSLAVLLLLGIAVLWARDVSWRKQEDQFHQAAHQWLKSETTRTEVYSNYRGYGKDWKETGIEFFDESADSLLKIDQMGLIPSQSPRPENEGLIFILMDPGDSVGSPYGFYLSPREDRGWIEIPEPNVDSWKNYELAPETCRALKQRIRELQKNGGTMGELK